MPLDLGIEYIYHRIEKAQDDMIYARWIAGPQYQISFNEFKEQLKPKRQRTDEQILKEVYSKFEKAGIK